MRGTKKYLYCFWGGIACCGVLFSLYVAIFAMNELLVIGGLIPATLFLFVQIRPIRD